MFFILLSYPSVKEHFATVLTPIHLLKDMKSVGSLPKLISEWWIYFCYKILKVLLREWMCFPNESLRLVSDSVAD